MELWDAYAADGRKTGAELIRGEKIPEGLFHLVVEIVVRHADGEHLFMRRDLNKPVFPGLYEMTVGGSALKGEDSLTAAKRELFEETGIRADALTSLLPRLVSPENHSIYDCYLCIYAGDKSAVALQEGETIDFRWLAREDALAFVRTDAFVPTVRERLRGYLDTL